MAEVFYNHVSERATVTNVFTVDGVATDPSTVTLVVTPPNGTPVTYTYPADIGKASTGSYTIDVTCSSTAAGTWQGVWIGTGTATDAAVVTWQTVPTDLSGLYCTPELLKDRAGITDALDDVTIMSACRSVKRWIDKYTGRHFNQVTTTKVFPTTGWYCLSVPDLVSVTTLRTDDGADGTYSTTWSTSDYELLPANAPTNVEPEPYTEINAIGSRSFPLNVAWTPGRTNRVQVAGVWGWPEIPTPVIEAAKILTADYVKLGGITFGVQGYGEYGLVRARLSKPALDMLDPYRKDIVLMA